MKAKVLIMIKVSCLLTLFSFNTNIFSSIGHESCNNNLKQLLTKDGFFRAIVFKKIEKICHQLRDDLDIVSLEESLYQKWFEQSGYLLRQFCDLYAAVEDLLSNQEESRMFLPDDISYLLTLIDALEATLIHTLFQEKSLDELGICMKVLLAQAKQKLEHLITHNIEVAFDPTMLEQHLTQC